MKRLLLSFILMLALSIPTSLHASDVPDYSLFTIKELINEIKNDIPTEAMPYYNRLTETQKTHYDGILDSYLEGNLESGYTVSVDEDIDTDSVYLDLITAYEAFNFEHKEFFFIGTIYGYGYQSNEDDASLLDYHITIYLAEDYYSFFDSSNKSTRVIDEDMVKSHFIEILSKRDLVYSHVNTLSSEYEKLRYIHDYLVLNNTYQKTNELSHTPAGALVDSQTAVCEAYAEAFQMLAHHANLIVTYATGEVFNSFGDVELHAWNHVNLQSLWFLVDVTWDDPLGAEIDYISYDYFLVPKIDDTLRSYSEMSIIPSPFATQAYDDIPSYTITIHIDGETYTQTVLSGGSIDETLFEKEGYDIVYDQESSNISQNGTFNGTYVLKTFVIRFFNGDTLLKEETVNYGEMPTEPEEPTRNKYTFSGWGDDISEAYENKDYKAVWILTDLYEPVEEGNPFKMIGILSLVGLVAIIGIVIGFRMFYRGFRGSSK